MDSQTNLFPQIGREFRDVNHNLHKTNYSFSTSLSPYIELQTSGQAQIQADLILGFIKSGACTIKELSEKTGLPSSTVSGRLSDLIKANKVSYSGHVTYRERLRKKIIVIA